MRKLFFTKNTIKIKVKIISLFFLIFTSNLDAQLYFFGRNKVHYEDFEWKVLKTEHFNIYYYDDFGEIAEIGAQYAEEAFEDLKIKFNHIIIHPIPLIFYNTHLHFQQTNTIPNFIPEGVGGFFEFMKGRVVIPYLSGLDQFRHVIKHELIHVFMTSKVMSSIRDHRVIGEKYPPLWFVEGLAEYWSTQWDTQAEMVMRDAVLNNIFAPLQDINRIYGSFLMYKEGQNFLEFVSKNYGEENILELIENFWRFKKFDEVIEFTLGENIGRIDDSWSYELKKKYYPLYNSKAPHFIDSKQITKKGFNFSPNYYADEKNKSIFFIANIDGYSSVYKMKYAPDSSDYVKPELLIRGEREAVFESFHLLKPSMTVSNKGLLAFITKNGPTDAIHIFSIKENKIIKTYSFNNLITIESPSFSNNGNLLTFSSTDNQGYIDIYSLNLINSELKRYTNDYYADKDPIFNHDNSKIIFSSDRTSGLYKQSNNLFELNIESGKIKYITYTNGNLSSPKYSPNYKRLFCLADNDGTKNLWEINFNNDEPVSMSQRTKFLTSIFEYSFVNNYELVTSSFEKFAFHFYSLNLQQIGESIQTEMSFNFNEIAEPWIPKKIKLNSEKDRLVYENEYSLDYAVSQISTDPIFGTRGGAILSLSDLLGDDRYYFVLFNSAEVQSDFFKNINVALSRVNSGGRTNYGYGIFHYIGRRYDIRQSDDFFYERNFGGFLSLIYPLSSFQRFETTISIANSDREEFSFISRKALLLSNSISFVHDNSIWGSTGPVDGSRLRLLLGYTSDIQFSNSNFYSFIADYRDYLRLDDRLTLAIRASLFYNHGKDARRYIAGGSWDLRGWKRFSLRGEKLWLSSLELRYPLIDQLYIKFPFFGLGFSSIRGALFFDAGSVWNDKYNQSIGSIGFGFRLNFLNAIAFRYDIGKKIENNFKSLQNGLFYQFFFGWDF